MPTTSGRSRRDLLCFSHLRWQFVFQRPQHLMTRFARDRRVFFVEEPVLVDAAEASVVTGVPAGVRLVVPPLPRTFDEADAIAAKRGILDALLERERIRRYVLW